VIPPRDREYLARRRERSRHGRRSLLVLLGALYLATLPASGATTLRTVTFPGADGATLQGWLYEPTPTSRRHPAVVAMHGCSGLIKAGKPRQHFEDWGQRLAGLGFEVLFPDSYTSRGVGSQCKKRDRAVSPSRQRTDDANAALTFLETRGNVKAQAISLLGWSNGGSTVLYAVEPRHAPRSSADFAKAAAFYPGCRTPLESRTWKTRMPLLVLIGAADDWTSAQPCVDLVARAKADGANADIVTYPGAYHDFDQPDLRVHSVGGLAYTASGTGRVHTGTNPEARADAVKRISAYLAR